MSRIIDINNTIKDKLCNDNNDKYQELKKYNIILKISILLIII